MKSRISLKGYLSLHFGSVAILPVINHRLSGMVLYNAVYADPHGNSASDYRALHFRDKYRLT